VSILEKKFAGNSMSTRRMGKGRTTRKVLRTEQSKMKTACLEVPGTHNRSLLLIRKRTSKEKDGHRSRETESLTQRRFNVAGMEKNVYI